MKGSIDRNGYRHGIINGKNENYHRIVAKLFCKKEEGKNFVNHKDGNKLNNNSENLEWVTRSENTLHSFRTGLQKRTNFGICYSKEEKEYMIKNKDMRIIDIANNLGRSADSVRKYIYKIRKGLEI